MRRHPASAALAVLMVAGCGSLDERPETDVLSPRAAVAGKPPLPTFPAAGGTGVVPLAVDGPLASNWNAGARRLEEHRFEITLRMRPWHTGGAGESAAVFRMAAERLARELGYRTYDLLAYSESIDSSFPLARRTARGIVGLR